jgi:hypothetical protein
LFFWGIFAMSASVKIDINKFFELCLLDRTFLSTKGLFKNNCLFRFLKQICWNKTKKGDIWTEHNLFKLAVMYNLILLSLIWAWPVLLVLYNINHSYFIQKNEGLLCWSVVFRTNVRISALKHSCSIPLPFPPDTGF